MDPKEYECVEENMWCPGCGNFGLKNALVKALTELDIKPKDLALIGGIGQSPKFTHYIRGNALDGLHGRAFTMAVGTKLANPKLKVIAFDGDGGAYAEGMNHFMQNIRRNVELIYFVNNNQVFGLTKGQASPTAENDMITKSTPHGIIFPRFNPVAVSLVNGGTFVARIYTANVEHSKEIIKQALTHKGTAFIDVLQPCVSFAKNKSYQYYKDKVYTLESVKHDPTNHSAALEKSFEWGAKIPIGLFYKAERGTFRDQYPGLKDNLELYKYTPPLEKIKEFIEELK